MNWWWKEFKREVFGFVICALIFVGALWAASKAGDRKGHQLRRDPEV